MILLICDDISNRLKYFSFLRCKHILAYAPQPIDFEQSMKDGKYKVILFYSPFSPILEVLETNDAPQIAIGEGSDKTLSHMHCCPDPRSPKLVSFLRSIDSYGRPSQVGAMYFRGNKTFNLGYRFRLTPEEYAVLMYIIDFGPSSPDEIGNVCVSKIVPDNKNRKRHDIVSVVSRINRKLLNMCGRRALRLVDGRYEFCDLDYYDEHDRLDDDYDKLEEEIHDGEEHSDPVNF